MTDADRKERTRRTARMLFHSLPRGVGFDLWKRFDPGLARELSLFFTGTLYSREVIPQTQRELCAVAALTVLHRPHELRAHIHAALNEQLDYDNYVVDLLPWGVLQLGTADAGADAFELPAGSPDHGRRVGAYYYWFFPNLMLNFYPWGLSVNVIRPIAVDLTKVNFITYVWKPQHLDRGAGAGLDRVEREDEAVVEATHRGLKSSFYGRGRYSPKRETGPHHFHRLCAAALRG